MIPVFICRVRHSLLRDRMYDLCYQRWVEEPGVSVRTLVPEALGCSVRDFQRERRVEAEELAKIASAPFYVVADDDCFPQGKPFVRQAVDILKRHPEFASLTPWPMSFEISRPQIPDFFEDDEVMEVGSAGNIRFTRTGAMKEWPPMLDGVPGYDLVHGPALREFGYRVGYMKPVKFQHLGEGASTIWPGHMRKAS